MVNGGWYIYQPFEGRFTWTEWFSLRSSYANSCVREFVHQKTYGIVKSTLLKRKGREKKFWTSFKFVAHRWAKKYFFHLPLMFTLLSSNERPNGTFCVCAAIIFDGTVNIGTIIPSKKKITSMHQISKWRIWFA